MSQSARSRTTSTGMRQPQQAPRANATPRQFDLPTAISRALTAELTAEQIRAHTYPWLTPIDQILPEDRLWRTYARHLSADLVELLVHRDGECLRRLTDDDVAKVGENELFTLARERLRQIRSPRCETVRHDRGEFHVLRGESEFTASKLLLLPDVLEPALGPAIHEPAGALISAPSRHELAFAPVSGDIAATLVHLARYALIAHDDSTNPLSPDTYWWHAGTLTPVVTVDRTGFVDFRLPPAFVDAANLST